VRKGKGLVSTVNSFGSAVTLWVILTGPSRNCSRPCRTPSAALSRLTAAIHAQLPHWKGRPLVQAIMYLRGSPGNGWAQPGSERNPGPGGIAASSRTVKRVP